FVASTRGQAGGYTLSRPAEEIRIGEALAELGGKLYDDEFCSRHAGHGEVCHHDTDCGVRFLWNRVQDAVDHALEGMTLADLLPTPA
ncbi:Rrf2 family transcriptional regulator, partial [Acinetobacter baumannii]